jgi:hypothetical protein
VWQGSEQALAVVQRKTYDQMLTEGFPMVIRATGPESYIVSRR